MKYFIIFWFSFYFGFSQTNAAFEKANQLYNSGEYQQAIAEYKAILEANEHAAGLYYNIANCHYRLNEIALSIFYYEKALLLKPDDEDIITNLGFAQKMTVDAIQEVPENGFSKLFNQVLDSTSLDGWAVRCVGLGFLFVFFFLSYYLSFSESKKRIFFVSSSVVLILFIGSLSLVFKKDSLDASKRPAIIFAKEVEAKSEPNLRAETSFTLHEGTKVMVIDNYKNEWSKIKLKNGETAWIANSELRTL